MTVGGYSIMLVPPHVTRVKHSSASFNGEHSGMTRASVSFPHILSGNPVLSLFMDTPRFNLGLSMCPNEFIG